MLQERIVFYEGQEICYLLEHKPVKNLNLRIHKDCQVYVSANPEVPTEKVDDFVINKGKYILSAQKRFYDLAQYAPQPKQYISGETFYLLGRGIRLKVEKSMRESIFTDGIFLYLSIKDPNDYSKKQKMVTRFLDEQCRITFCEIISKFYPIFQKYGIKEPILRIRNMETRWGSCLAQKGIITLNKRLLEAPRNCIEYVALHELCHLIHPNHSKSFYKFLTMLMPDWKERKLILDRNAAFGL